jgi:hypothetical protein
LCPHCTEGKQEEAAKLTQAALVATKDTHDAYMLTLTIPTTKSVSTQVRWLSKSYASFVNAFKSAMIRRGFTPDLGWSKDLTVDTENYKTHLHLHLILRIKKGFDKGDLESIVFEQWSRAVKKITNRTVSFKAFYFAEVITSGQASRYLFKAVREALVSKNKVEAFKNRVSWFGLMDLISQGRDDLLDTYHSVIDAMKRQKWFVLSKKMRADALAALELEEDDKLDDQEEDERTITPIRASPQTHAALADAGAIPTLLYVLKTKKDGDAEVERLRELVDGWSRILSRWNLDTTLIPEAIHDFKEWMSFVSGSCAVSGSTG